MDTWKDANQIYQKCLLINCSRIKSSNVHYNASLNVVFIVSQPDAIFNILFQLFSWFWWVLEKKSNNFLVCWPLKGKQLNDSVSQNSNKDSTPQNLPRRDWKIMHRQAKQWFFSDPLIKSFEEEPPMSDWVHGQGQCSKRSSLSRYSNHEKSFSNGLPTLFIAH